MIDKFWIDACVCGGSIAREDEVGERGIEHDLVCVHCGVRICQNDGSEMTKDKLYVMTKLIKQMREQALSESEKNTEKQRKQWREEKRKQRAGECLD